MITGSVSSGFSSNIQWTHPSRVTPFTLLSPAAAS